MEKKKSRKKFSALQSVCIESGRREARGRKRLTKSNKVLQHFPVLEKSEQIIIKNKNVQRD